MSAVLQLHPPCSQIPMTAVLKMPVHRARQRSSRPGNHPRDGIVVLPHAGKEPKTPLKAHDIRIGREILRELFIEEPRGRGGDAQRHSGITLRKGWTETPERVLALSGGECAG